MTVTSSQNDSSGTEHRLLKTKLYVPPPRANLVSRPRLIERLHASLAHRLVLISAPAGFGKTTLLSEWISQSNTPTAWVSLDEGDNDPAQFLAYVIAALQTLQADIGKHDLSVLQSPQPPPIDFLLTNLINDITLVDHHFAFVLDDYHLIDAKPIHDILQFLLDHLPDPMHLVIATRADPPLPLARLRARNQLTEFRAADLCFTTDEAAAFFNKAMNLDLSSDDIALLETRTEGWIAGLQLAALSMQNRQDVSSFIRAFTGDDRHIVDYLAEEVLNRQPEPVQSFLLRTSILDRLSGPLCNAVAQRSDAQAMLEMLERRNLFIVPLDNERRWYRYHHLFANLLHHRLQQTEPEEIPDLHGRASEWYAANNLVPEAINHALAGGDTERAADLVESIAMTLVKESKLSTLQRWLNKLPEELLGDHPWLCISQAWAHFVSGRLDEIEPLLQKVESRLSMLEDNEASETLADTQDILGHVVSIRAFIVRGRGDVPRTILLSQDGLKRLPKKDSFARSALALNLGYAYLIAGELESASRYLEMASTIGETRGHPYVALAAIYSLASIEVRKGKLHQAAKVFEKALRLGTEWGSGSPLPATGYAYVGMGQVLYEWNDLDEAARHVSRGIELGEQAEDWAIPFRGYIAMVRLKLAFGAPDDASQALDRAQAIAVKSIRVLDDTPEWQPRLWQVRLWLAQGDLAAAGRWAAETESHKLDDATEFEHLTLARVLIAQDRSSEAVDLLNRLLKQAEASGRTGSVIETRLLQALAYEGQGDTTEALAALEQALTLAEPEGYVRVFVDEGPPMAKLLRKAATQGIAPKYVKKLLSAFEPKSAVKPEIRNLQSALVEPLSERELEVLHLIAAGLSNQQIAKELFISLNTVKTHVKNINSKLDVRNRTEATARARELGLL
jgi:LuxR family maltose regulon positive regulatory protein